MKNNIIKLYEETQFYNPEIIQDIAGAVLYCKEIEEQDDKEWLKMICKYIGCTGTSQECPGNPECLILRKFKYIKSGLDKEG